jgi:hypothetical protein
MKLPHLIFALFVIATWPALAHADTWCIRDSAGIVDPICAFSSAEDCIHAAIVGPSGAVCVRDDINTVAKTTEKGRSRSRVAHLRLRADN